MSDVATRKREYERQRKQRYRAEERREKKAMEWLVWQLEGELERTRATKAASYRQLCVWQDVASDVLHRRCVSTAQNAHLRSDVHRLQCILRTLETWVVRSVPPVLADGQPWLHSTLLADPISRKYGFRWLTDRVFHVGARLFSPTVDDGLRVDFQTDKDTLDVLSVQVFGTHTLFGDFRVAANIIWDAIGTNVHAKLDMVVVADADDMVYVREFNPEFGTSYCKLARRYDLPTRVVLAFVDVADDECFPLADHEVRPHGFTLVVLERVTPDITLRYQLSVHYSPLTCRGPIPFDQSVAIFGVQPHPTSREVTIAWLEDTALRNMLARKQVVDRLLQDKMDTLAISANHTTAS
ncbi:Aste57867_20501 [Aphanomyces stellatus]|uniref:Aste57867_20501 protein n=1 Tax=Aphanomyces stellatus TaxID=120398 RepID=A0A485LGK3_9STRA|nr:hypothetical protein As57867_020435 [Aphanomyces stellatus]VFT97186.1 Aste57867_20501 [Aphanomyces stellatus]